VNVLPHVRPVKEFVEADPGAEVQAAVEKREEAEHPAKTDELRQAQDFPQWSDCQSDDHEPQRPIAGPVGDEFNGVGREVRIEWQSLGQGVHNAPNEQLERD
jgi:hypothetical protein